MILYLHYVYIMSTTSAIDAKNQDDNDDGKTNNWGSFFASMIQNLVGIIIFTIIGCNWIFMAHNDSLDLIFPTKISDYLTQSSNRDYRDIKVPGIPIQGGGGRRRRNVQRGGGNDYTCKPSMCSGNSGISKPNTDFMKILGYGQSMAESWPYDLYNGDDTTGFSWDGFKNWFARSEASSFMYYRYFIKNVFRGGPEAYFKNLVPDIAIFFIATIFAHFLPFVVLLCSLVTTVGSWVVGGEMWWAYTLIGLIVPYLAFMLIGNAAVQMLSALYNLFLAPLFIDYKTVAEIARCNMKWISFLFAALTIGSAFQHLESVTATTMLVTWIILAIKACFF